MERCRIQRRQIANTVAVSRVVVAAIVVVTLTFAQAVCERRVGFRGATAACMSRVVALISHRCCSHCHCHCRRWRRMNSCAMQTVGLLRPPTPRPTTSARTTTFGGAVRPHIATTNAGDVKYIIAFVQGKRTTELQLSSAAPARVSGRHTAPRSTEGTAVGVIASSAFSIT
jgi:hypothetical protein